MTQFGVECRLSSETAKCFANRALAMKGGYAYMRGLSRPKTRVSARWREVRACSSPFSKSTMNEIGRNNPTDQGSRGVIGVWSLVAAPH